MKTVRILGLEYEVSVQATQNEKELILKGAKLLESMSNTGNLRNVRSPIVAASITEGPGRASVGFLMDDGSWVWMDD